MSAGPASRRDLKHALFTLSRSGRDLHLKRAREFRAGRWHGSGTETFLGPSSEAAEVGVPVVGGWGYGPQATSAWLTVSGRSPEITEATVRSFIPRPCTEHPPCAQPTDQSRAGVKALWEGLAK